MKHKSEIQLSAYIYFKQKWTETVIQWQFRGEIMLYSMGNDFSEFLEEIQMHQHHKKQNKDKQELA